MIEIVVPGESFYDEDNEQFIDTETHTYKFEHSLRSVSLWESKYQIPFLEDNIKTPESLLEYYEMMCLDSSFTFDNLGSDSVKMDVLNQLAAYVGDPQSATTIHPANNSNSRRIMTSEVIYAYMSNGQVPYSCEDWNLNRLLKVLGVLSVLNGPQKEMSKNEIYEQNRRLNEERKRKYNTKG